MMDTAMASKGPVTDDERAHIVELLRSGMSYAKVREATGRGAGTIAAIAKAAGLNAEQSAAARTRAARAARSAFSAERRAETAALAQERAHQVLEQLTEPQTVVTAQGEQVVVPIDARGIKDRAQAVQLLQRTVLDISKHDVKADEGQAGGLLVQFVDQLRGPAEEGNESEAA